MIVIKLSSPFNFRGSKCRLVKDKIPEKVQHMFNNFHIYDIRHSDHDDNDPCTIEERVAINKYATLISDERIELNDGTDTDKYLNIDDNEKYIIESAYEELFR